MKKFIKKFFKWTGITLLVLIIALILIPIIFKDEIKQLVIDEVNKSLTAELQLDDFDLTFISTFPNMTIELYGARLKGKGDFKGVTLADIKEVSAHVGFWSVVSGDQIDIDEVHIYDPTFDIRVLEDGKANYDIVKPDSVKTPEELEEPSSFKLSLKEYSVNNATIIYDDRSFDMYTRIDSLTHKGTGDLTADVIDFKTETAMGKLTYQMDGIDYLTDVKTEAIVNLLMEFTDKTSKFTLKENSLKMNEITLSFDGYYEMLDGYDKMDIKLDASEATFKQFLSLIPAFYQTGYEGMVSSGDMKLAGFVKGKMDATNMPGWDFGMKVKNASIKYPDLPGRISNIQIDAGSKFPGGEDLDKMTIEVPKFAASFDKNRIDANLFMRQLMSDPFLQSRIMAKVDLATLKNYIPMAEGESYTGKLDADVDIKGKMSDLEAGDFEAFTAKGNLILSQMKYESPSIPEPVDIEKMKFTFAPQNLTLDHLDATMGTSDFHMDGKVDNYFGYMLRDEVLKGNFNYSSKNLDVDKLMAGYDSGENGAAEDAPAAESPSSEEPILIPGNIDFVLNSKIGKLRYNGIDIKNIDGNITLRDEVAKLDNLNMDAMGGNIGLTGAYNTQNHKKPKLDFGYKLNEIDINQLATNFLTVGKLAPIAKYATGKISSDFDMQTDLTASFEPILESLTSVGDIRSKSLVIKDIKVLEKIESVTKLQNLSDQTLKDFKTKFKVKDGKVSLLPFNVALGKINSNVSGYTTLDQKMNYDFLMNVPKEMIPASMIREVESAMSKLNSALPGLNVGKLPDVIPVTVHAAGDMKDPKITTDFKEAILKATGEFKDDLIENITQTVKDTVRAIVDDKIDDAKAEIEKQKQKIMADAQKQADAAKAEGKKQADAIRKEADKTYEDYVAGAKNPLDKKAREASGKIARDKAYKTADEVEATANKKADDIMVKAKEKADKLG